MQCKSPTLASSNVTGNVRTVNHSTIVGNITNGRHAMVSYEVLLRDGSTERIDGADSYEQEGPLTTFFETADDRRVIDCWSVRLTSIRTVDIVRIRRSESAGYASVTELREAV